MTHGGDHMLEPFTAQEEVTVRAFAEQLKGLDSVYTPMLLTVADKIAARLPPPPPPLSDADPGHPYYPIVTIGDVTIRARVSGQLFVRWADGTDELYSGGDSLQSVEADVRKRLGLPPSSR